MSGDQQASSFGDPNAQPPTPRQTALQTPKSIAASPVFETPKSTQGFFTEAAGWTPSYAEAYSVFNATPGNLRGNDSPFVDFHSTNPAGTTGAHKRLLSAESLASEIATQTTHFSPNLDGSLPPVEPSRRLLSSPATSRSIPQTDGLSSRTTPTQGSKKSRRGTITQPPPTQVPTPPPTARKGERKIAPKVTMQNDQSFDSIAYADASQQQHDMAAMMGNPGDMFSYPMSAPVSAPPNFWDPAVSMSMDMDFAGAGPDVFQQANMLQDPSASFDWNASMDLFQDPSAQPPPPSSNQENIHPVRHEQPLAPKSAVGEQMSMDGSHPSVQGNYPMTTMNESFSLISPSHAVDPGLLFGRPQTSATDASFSGMAPATGSAEAAIAGTSKDTAGGPLRRNNGTKAARNGKMPDRAYVSSPIKPPARPGLGRSLSENKGKKSKARGPLPVLAPAVRSLAPAPSGSGIEGARPAVRSTGRTSPLKNQHRLSQLTSIPEVSSQPRSRTSVRFTIDAHGRARAETTLISDGHEPSRGLSRSQSSRELGNDNWDSSDSESSTDDEPIILPSRNNSFNTSFALPDPRKPVGSIFHQPKRSLSDRSTSTVTGDTNGPGGNGAESEAETVMEDAQAKGGDAMSELRKVVEDRQKRTSQMASSRSQRFLPNHRRSFSGIISPTSLTDSSYASHGGLNVRCVCNRNEADEPSGYMVQCESCEMFLHGKCINITKRSMPRVYICAFCANTPNMRGGRMRDAGRRNTLAMAPGSSPLASKSFRSFR